MNDRIKELAEQQGLTGPNYLISSQELEKFAQLIVRECVECLQPLSRNHSMVGAAQDTIRDHFGVEE